MKLLFCKTKYIGDALLLTGTLRAVKKRFPEAEITVVVREGTEGILAGSPDIDRLMTVSKPKEHGRKSPGWLRDLRVIRELRKLRFDHAFELSDADRGRTIVALAGAKNRHANTIRVRSRFWRKVYGDAIRADHSGAASALSDYRTVAAVLGLPETTESRPVFARERADFSAARKLVGERPALLVHPVASLASKIWPMDNWIRFLDGLTGRFDIVLSSGPAPDEIAMCERILAGVADKTAARFTGGRLGWRELAGVLYSTSGYIGADTAAMHLASACGLPILGVFGGNASAHLAQWTPAGGNVRIVTFGAGENGIADIPISRVVAAFETLFPIPGHD